MLGCQKGTILCVNEANATQKETLLLKQQTRFVQIFNIITDNHKAFAKIKNAASQIETFLLK